MLSPVINQVGFNVSTVILCTYFDYQQLKKVGTALGMVESVGACHCRCCR
jgi:hypothetical protein